MDRKLVKHDSNSQTLRSLGSGLLHGEGSLVAGSARHGRLSGNWWLAAALELDLFPGNRSPRPLLPDFTEVEGAGN